MRPLSDGNSFEGFPDLVQDSFWTRPAFLPVCIGESGKNREKCGRSPGSVCHEVGKRVGEIISKRHSSWQNEIFDNATSMVPRCNLSFFSLGPLCFLGLRGPNEEIPRTGPRNPRPTRGETEVPHRMKRGGFEVAKRTNRKKVSNVPRIRQFVTPFFEARPQKRSVSQKKLPNVPSLFEARHINSKTPSHF